MTVTLDLSPELESRLQQEAERCGLDVPTLIRSVLDTTLPGPDSRTSPPGEPTEVELEEFFAVMAEGSEARPLLPPETFDRESIYAEHD